MRTFGIGDIHGAARPLENLLKEVNFDFENDRLFQIGDIADGWPEVPECVDILLKVKNLIAIRGNHDVWLYDWLVYGREPNLWLQQGGQATKDAYIRTGQMHEHREFFQNQVDWYLDEKNRLFIHGGWDYTDDRGWEFGASGLINAGSIAKECHWNRSLLYGARSGKHNGFNPLKQFNEVYIGHTATNNHSVENILNLWNLDSGAGWHGRLSIMDIDTKEITYAEKTMDLYPGVQGR